MIESKMIDPKWSTGKLRNLPSKMIDKMTGTKMIDWRLKKLPTKMINQMIDNKMIDAWRHR